MRGRRRRLFGLAHFHCTPLPRFSGSPPSQRPSNASTTRRSFITPCRMVATGESGEQRRPPGSVAGNSQKPASNPSAGRCRTSTRPSRQIRSARCRTSRDFGRLPVFGNRSISPRRRATQNLRTGQPSQRGPVGVQTVAPSSIRDSLKAPGRFAGTSKPASFHSRAWPVPDFTFWRTQNNRANTRATLPSTKGSR